MSDTEMKSEDEPPIKEEQITEQGEEEMEPEHDDNDIVNTNSEMVLDDILGDDIIGESSDQETTDKGRKKIQAPGHSRSRSNSYASDLSSTASISKRISKPDWHNLDARYFVIKSNNQDNVDISMEKSVWATPRRNETMLVEAFRHTKHVILIFSVRESGAFQGVARMMSMPRPNKGDVHWVVGSTPVLRLLPNYFKIQWLDKTALEFTKTAHLKNRWNEYKQVKISRDGQEVEPTCAAELCTLWSNCEDPESHLPIIASSPSSSAARAIRRKEEPVSPSEVKTTYSTYKDNSYTRASPEPYFDGEEPAPPGTNRPSRAPMEDRLGSREERKRRDNRPGTTRRSDPPPRRSDPTHHRSSRHREERGRRVGGDRDERGNRRAWGAGGGRANNWDNNRRRSRSPNERRDRGGDRGGERSERGSGDKGSAKDILLHGSYMDYVREYQSQQSRLASLLQDPVLRQDIFNAAQLAANTTSSSKGSSSSSRKRKEEKYLDSRAHSALVDEFLSTHSNNRR